MAIHVANSPIPFSQNSQRTTGYILVADDYPLNRLATRDLLESVGHRVVEVENGLEALEAIAAEPLDLVLLDVMMPGLDGFEVCNRIKANEQARLLPVMMMTALDDRKIRVRGIEAGADDFLSKPYDCVELVARVQSLIQQKRLNDDLDNAAQVLIAIAQAVESRDPTTGDHCKRLSEMGRSFGSYLNLFSPQLKALELAGYLHDIGKIGIPDSILGKPGKHTPEEQAIMQSHVEIGARICQPLRTMKHVLPIIRNHHERWDGSGYPDGLKGEDIPYLARVFQIIDIYDALISERPYKPVFTADRALSILESESEKGWWDPVLVDRFLQFLRPCDCPSTPSKLLQPQTVR